MNLRLPFRTRRQPKLTDYHLNYEVAGFRADAVKRSSRILSSDHFNIECLRQKSVASLAVSDGSSNIG
jgi:hypothetical protein